MSKPYLREHKIMPFFSRYGVCTLPLLAAPKWQLPAASVPWSRSLGPHVRAWEQPPPSCTHIRSAALEQAVGSGGCQHSPVVPLASSLLAAVFGSTLELFALARGD